MRKNLLIVMLFGMTVGWTPGAHPQEQPPPAAQSEARLQTAEGKLSNFDREQRLIWIDINDGGEMQFSYTAETPLIGATRTLQIGDLLKIHYQAESGVNRVVRVEVNNLQAGP